MRKVIFLLIVILSLPTTLWAADPIIGTWKLKSTNQTNVKDEIIIYSETEGDMIKLTSSILYKDGSSDDSKKLTWPREGGIVEPVAGKHPEIRLDVAILVGPGHWYFSTMINGRLVVTRNKTVSEDGKTLTWKVSGIDRDGSKLDRIIVYERQ